MLKAIKNLRTLKGDAGICGYRNLTHGFFLTAKWRFDLMIVRPVSLNYSGNQTNLSGDLQQLGGRVKE